MAVFVWTTLVISCTVLVIYQLLRKIWVWLKMPPGPWGLPFIGYIPWVHPTCPWETFTSLKRKYGPVMSLNFCGQQQIILSDWESITEAFCMTDLNSRPRMILFEVARTNHKGLQGEAKVWHDNRTFLLRSMRSFGVGRSSLETLVGHEFGSLMMSYKKDVGKPMEIDGRLDVAVLNIIWKICTGKQTSLDDERTQGLIHLLADIGNLVNDLGPAQFFPALIRVVPKFKTVWEQANELSPKLMAEFERELQEHKDCIKENPSHVPQDIIDDYLRERAAKQSGDADTAASYADEHLLSVITMLFAAGTDTTATTARYACIFLAQHPEVQDNCHKELDTVVGQGRLPSWESDRSKLPYIEATIHEIQRLADIVPLGVPHAAVRDTKLRGYFIPKGAWLISNINACHRDPKYWPEPDRFDPSRFLNEEGKLKKNMPSFLPFAAGRRRCLGERLASMELFIFISYLLHHYRLEFPEGFAPDLKTNAGDPITRRPAPFRVILSIRESSR